MSTMPYIIFGVIFGVMFGLFLAGLLRGNACQDAWWRGYAEGRRDEFNDASFTVVREGPVFRRSSAKETP